MTILLLLLAALVAAELWLLCLQCRHSHPLLDTLRRFRYAHRGLHCKGSVPENSMAAFRRAVESGYGAELDVHLMADGNLAVIHDSSLLRTAGADVEVEDLTAEDLATYRLENTAEHIPLFGEVLALFAGRTPLVVELKAARGNHNALTAAAVAELDKYRLTYCIESFDPRCLRWLKKHRGDIVRGQLSENFLRHGDDGQQSKAVLWALQNLLLNFLGRPDFIAYRAEDRDCLPLRLCRKIYRAAEFSWTVRGEAQIAQVEKDGCVPIFEQDDT